MPLIIEFKQALLKAVNDFSQKEVKLTELQAQSVIEIKRLIDTMDSGIHLRQEISIKLRHLPSKTFAFLPFVNDLPKELRKVLADPQFAEGQLLIAGYCDLRIENNQLREENKLLRQEFEAFKKEGLAQEIAITLQNLKQENIRLNDELVQHDIQHKQELEVITTEKSILEENIISLTNDNQSLQQKLTETEQEKQQLADSFLQKVDENTRLKEENQRLKEQLEVYKQSKAVEPSKQNTPTPRKSYLFTN